MGRDTNRVERVDVLGEAITNSFAFALEGAKEAIPGNEDAAIVLIEIFRLCAVVHAVVRWRVENLLGLTETINCFGMDPELVDQVDCSSVFDHAGSEPEPGHESVGHEHSKDIGDWLTKRGGEVVVLAGMVNHMNGP